MLWLLFLVPVTATQPFSLTFTQTYHTGPLIICFLNKFQFDTRRKSGMMRVHDPVGGLQDASSWAVGLKNISLAQKKAMVL